MTPQIAYPSGHRYVGTTILYPAIVPDIELQDGELGIVIEPKICEGCGKPGFRKLGTTNILCSNCGKIHNPEARKQVNWATIKWKHLPSTT